MITFVEKGIVKTLYQVTAGPRSVINPGDESFVKNDVNIGGLDVQPGDYLFLDSKQANTYGGNGSNVVVAVSNNSLAALANTNSNGTVHLESVGLSASA